jgi:hypothetical protein
MRGCGRLEKTLQKAARPTPTPPGHQDQAYGEPFGDVVYGDGERDEQAQVRPAAEGDPEAHALREGVGGHDADDEESPARIQPAKAREDRRVLLDTQ